MNFVVFGDADYVKDVSHAAAKRRNGFCNTRWVAAPPREKPKK
jgi:hypothetical protein